jgi:hypothetical protein
MKRIALTLKKSFKYLIILLAGMALVLNSCKEDCPSCQDPTNPDCENYDPCFGKTTINSYFMVERGSNGFPPPPQWCTDIISKSDTFSSTTIRFKVPSGNPGSTYEWQVGSEVTARTDDEFQVSFYDDLQENGWERFIPVTLTIRSPVNNCLDNPADTLIAVTRNIFFTNVSGGTAVFLRGTNRKFKGHFSSEPDKEVILETIWNNIFNFRGETPDHWLIVGLPIVDTLMLPEDGCGFLSGCGTYVHSYNRWERTSVCSWVELTKYITDTEILFDYNKYEVTIRFQSTVSGHEFKEEFIGKEM